MTDVDIVMPSRKFCSCTAGQPLTEDQCKGKIEAITMSRLSDVSVALLVIQVFFVAITWFTFQAMSAYKAGDEDYDEDEPDAEALE